jgi:diguanylate cyclase (GGDEF)-like protein/PAS domain S-box-containing protein
MRITEIVDNSVSSKVVLSRLVIIALAYFITGRLGLEFAIISASITLIWLPTGIAVAALFRWGWRYFWAVWLGALAVNLAIGSSLLIAFGISIGNTLAPLLAVFLLRRWHFNADILSWRDVPVFVVSGIIGMMVSAAGGVTVLALAGVIPWEATGWAWLAWWLGDAVGVIVGGMAAVTFNRDKLRHKPRKELLISIAVVLVIGLAWIFISADPIGHIFLIPIIVLLLVWIALQLGAFPAAIAVLILSACAAFALATGRGPFLDQNIHLAIAKLWGYITTLSVLTMLVSALSAEREQLREALQGSEQKYRLIAENTSDGIVVFDADSHIRYVSPAYLKQLGYSEQEELSRDANSVYSIIHPDDRDSLFADIFKAIELKKTRLTYSYRIKHKAGHYIWREDSAKFNYDNLDNYQGVYVSCRDVTKRKEKETELRIAATVFESHEGMLISDTNNIILKVNQSFSKITGYDNNEVIGRTPRILKSGQHDKAFYAALWQDLINSGTWQGEIWNRRKNGEIYPEWLCITAVTENNIVSHYVATFIDITERKNNEQTINQLAFYDSLTELPNRRFLFERIKHAVNFSNQTGETFALLMLDLDKFKALNDSFGHTTGDDVLQQVAKRIKGRLRKIDMVARLGGDEFIILLENVDHYEMVTRFAEAIIHELSQPFSLYQTHEASISTSIGIVLYPQHGNNAETLMDNVEIALYHAKDQGRNCFAYFSDELTQKARERLALEVRLRRAIEKKQLQVYFQAQIDINSGRIIGAEALVRWNDPVHGFTPPIQFIPVAEETGLIIALGEFVLRETCRLGKQWLDEGLPAIALAVNVSPYQFRHCDINALATKILSETGFSVEYLELEITESGLMDNQQQAMAILNNLHTQGVRLAIDDFGTGYSSLAYLKFFPLDVLKIDKSFIDDIPFLQSDMAIASTIIAMAHHLGFKVLAEGVETQAQLDFLREHGCDSYQGYLYSKPIPADDFAKLLLKNG